MKEAELKRQWAAKEGKSFQLYLLDVMLQGESGYALCRKIRETEDTPIIFLTALDDEESVIRGLEIGGDDYVTKPFRSRELLSRIQANLRRYTAMLSEETRTCIRSGELVFVMGKNGFILRGKI